MNIKTSLQDYIDRNKDEPFKTDRFYAAQMAYDCLQEIERLEAIIKDLESKD